MYREMLLETMFEMGRRAKGAPLTQAERQEIDRVFAAQDAGTGFGKAAVAVAQVLNTTLPRLLEKVEADDGDLLEKVRKAAEQWEKESGALS